MVEEPGSKVNSEFNKSPRSEKDPRLHQCLSQVLQMKKENRLDLKKSGLFKLKEERKIDYSDCLIKSKVDNNDRTKDTEVFFNEFVQQISHKISKQNDEKHRFSQNSKHSKSSKEPKS